MPAALAALHRFLRDRRTKWLWLFALALLLQGLSATYYLLFFFVLLALWLLWIAPARVAHSRRHQRTPAHPRSPRLGPDRQSWSGLAHSPVLRVFPHAGRGDTLQRGSDVVRHGVTDSARLGIHGRARLESRAAALSRTHDRRARARRNRRRHPSRTNGRSAMAARIDRITAALVPLRGGCAVVRVRRSVARPARWRADSSDGLDVQPTSVALLALAAGLAMRPSMRAAWQRGSPLVPMHSRQASCFCARWDRHPHSSARSFSTRPHAVLADGAARLHRCRSSADALCDAGRPHAGDCGGVGVRRLRSPHRDGERSRRSRSPASSPPARLRTWRCCRRQRSGRCLQHTRSTRL